MKTGPIATGKREGTTARAGTRGAATSTLQPPSLGETALLHDPNLTQHEDRISSRDRGHVRRVTPKYSQGESIVITPRQARARRGGQQ